MREKVVTKWLYKYHFSYILGDSFPMGALGIPAYVNGGRERARTHTHHACNDIKRSDLSLS